MVIMVIIKRAFIIVAIAILFAIAIASTVSATGEIVINRGSALLEVNRSMQLEYGYKLLVKEIKFDRSSGIKTVKLALLKDNITLDEKNLQNEKMSAKIPRYIYKKDNIKLIKADLDIKYDILDLIYNQSPKYSCQLYNVYQYWEDAPEFEEHIKTQLRIIKFEITSLYGGRYGKLILQHNQFANKSFNIKNTTIEITANNTKYVFPPEKTFWGDRGFIVVTDDDNSYPMMNEDDIFICRVGYPGDMPSLSGKTTLAIIAEDGEKVEINFTARSGNVQYEFKTAAIPFYSNPRGAEIKVNGVRVGSAPSTIKIPYGKRTIEMKLNGEPSWKVTLNIFSSSPPKLRDGIRYFIGEGEGSLHISSDPDGARVYLNGTYMGKTNSLLTNIPLGSYILTLEKEGYENWSEEVSINKSIIPISINLTKKVDITPTIPPNASAEAPPVATPVQSPEFKVELAILASILYLYIGRYLKK
jgi:hypothetical protein